MSSASAAPTSPTSATSSPAALPGAASSALNGVVSRIKEASAGVIKQAKPWSEVFDRTVMNKPTTFGEALTRIKKNSSYFRVNYLLVLLATCVVTFAVNPTALIVLGLIVAGWIWALFIRTSPIVINGRTLSDKETTIGLSAISFITIFFLTSVGTVLFSALSLSMAIVVLHGAFREPDNLFIDEAAESQPFLSFLTGPAVPVAMAAV